MRVYKIQLVLLGVAVINFQEHESQIIPDGQRMKILEACLNNTADDERGIKKSCDSSHSISAEVFVQSKFHLQEN